MHTLLPNNAGVAEVAGLLALMLLTDARRPARTSPDGGLIPLAEQDRTLWNRQLIAEGSALITDAVARGAIGPCPEHRPAGKDSRPKPRQDP